MQTELTNAKQNTKLKIKYANRNLNVKCKTKTKQNKMLKGFMRVFFSLNYANKHS